MHLRSLILQNFRSHVETQIEFTPGVNLIYGPNGAGKTNLLEAIHYACLSKSFITASDSFALRRGAPFFEIEARVADLGRAERRLKVIYARGEGKRVFVDGAPLDRLSDVVGIVPVVVYSPEDHVLTAGGPDERRRFLNNIMSQERPRFMDDLLKYRRTLRQRNDLLGRAQQGMLTHAQEPVLLSWTEEYLSVAARIIGARARFVHAFSTYLESAYQLLGEEIERPSISYTGFDDVSELDERAIVDRLRGRVERVFARERETGRTAIGPHRDELDFRLNGLDVRRFASHGQHRTFGMALKLAQYLYLKDRLETDPLLLLDDVFGILDPVRTATILNLLQSDSIGTSFITATHLEPFSAIVEFEMPENQAMAVSAHSDSGAAVEIIRTTSNRM